MLIVAGGLAAGVAAPARAADGLKLSGSVRLRHESIAGQARAGFNSKDEVTSLRTTALAEYDSGPVRIVAELYDSRAYGANAGTPLTSNEVNSFEPVQAYIAARLGNDHNGGTAITLAAGRMLLNIGSRRLIAADDYRNTTNSYTGLKADIAGPRGLTATLIYVLPQYRRPDDLPALRDNDARVDRESFDLVLWGGTVAQAQALGPATAELSFYHLGEGDSPAVPTRNRSLDTVGGRVVRDPAPGAIDYEVEAYYQWGATRSSIAAAAPELDVGATFVHAEAGYTLATTWQPRIAFEFDRAGGDRPGGRFTRFDTLFGMRRGDFAPSGIYATSGRANIVAAGLRAEASPSKRLDGFLTYKALWLAAATDAFSTSGVRDARGASGDFAGHQFDARLRYWLVPKALRFEFDGVVLAKGRFLRDAPNAPGGGATRYASFNLSAFF